MIDKNYIFSYNQRRTLNNTPEYNTMTPTVSYTLTSAFKSCLKRYVQFSGRACRSEYWFWTLATFLLGFAITLIGTILGITMNSVEIINATNTLTNLLTLAFFIPGLAVSVRRLHDTGRSAWNLLWALLPFIGAIVLIVFACQPSADANQYGEGPAAPEA